MLHRIFLDCSSSSRTEQRCQQPDAAIAILNTSGMNDRVQQQTLHVDENMSFLAFDQFARIEPVRINAGPPFSALHALAVDDASGGAGLSLRLLAAFDVQCVMDPIQRAVAMPPRKIVMQRAARRKVFWDVPPLHNAVHDGPHVGPPLTAATSGGRDQRLDMRPLVISQVARISQVIAVVLRPVLVRPQWRPLPES